MQKKTFKAGVLWLHRWLGLISGLVVVVVSVTGCLFVFQKEINRWVRADLRSVDTATQTERAEGARPRLPLEELQRRAADTLGVERLAYGLTTFGDPGRTWKAFTFQYGEPTWTYFGSIKEYETAYIDPYTGEVAGVVDEERDFFQVVKALHWSLLLATPIGQPIVVWATVVFVVLLVSGLILWWPRWWNRRERRRSFRVRWKATLYRLNYDLHNVLGFYALVVALIIALTGFYWAFPVAKKSLYFLGTGEYRLPPESQQQVQSEPVPSPGSGQSGSPLEAAYAKAWGEYPGAHRITFTSPAPSDSQGTIQATVYRDGGVYYGKSHLQFDRYTGELLHNAPYSQKNAGEKLLEMNYDIHVGAIGGLPGKLIAFLASLISASLPVTGFIIWWKKKRKGKSSRLKAES